MSDIPETLRVVPSIPHEQQTAEQLRAEMEYWSRKVSEAPGFASAYFADQQRKGCEAWLVRRIGEQAHA